MAESSNPERPQLDGLSRAEAERLLQEVGPNEITRETSKPAWSLLLAQFDSPMIWLLLAACVVSAALGEVADAIAIGAIVIIAGNVGELAVVFTAALAGLPAPLLPLHLLDQPGDQWRSSAGAGALPAVKTLSAFAWALESRSLPEACSSREFP
jgi:hypothetical protein